MKGKFKGGKNPMAMVVMCVETGEVFQSCVEAAISIYSKYRSYGYISKAAKLNKRYKGYHFKFILNTE